MSSIEDRKQNFIQKAREVHSNKYYYSEVEYFSKLSDASIDNDNDEYINVFTNKGTAKRIKIKDLTFLKK